MVKIDPEDIDIDFSNILYVINNEWVNNTPNFLYYVDFMLCKFMFRTVYMYIEIYLLPTRNMIFFDKEFRLVTGGGNYNRNKTQSEITLNSPSGDRILKYSNCTGLKQKEMYVVIKK